LCLRLGFASFLLCFNESLCDKYFECSSRDLCQWVCGFCRNLKNNMGAYESVYIGNKHKGYFLFKGTCSINCSNFHCVNDIYYSLYQRFKSDKKINYKGKFIG